MADVIPHPDEVAAARTGIYMQLKETTKLVETYGSLAQSIETLGLGDFIENQVKVNASQTAWVRAMEVRMRNRKVDDRSHFSKRMQDGGW